MDSSITEEALDKGKSKINKVMQENYRLIF